MQHKYSYKRYFIIDQQIARNFYALMFRGGSLKMVRDVVREYAGNLGDTQETEDGENSQDNQASP